MWAASVYRPKKNNDNKSVCFYTPFQVSLSSLLLFFAGSWNGPIWNSATNPEQSDYYGNYTSQSLHW